jgi:hypothetical protein
VVAGEGKERAVTYPTGSFLRADGDDDFGSIMGGSIRRNKVVREYDEQANQHVVDRKMKSQRISEETRHIMEIS